jgi:cytochrome c oxidase assembly protein subunit 15
MYLFLFFLYSLNRHMELEDFKGIFYWEWGHRNIGRFIGMSIILPALYFAKRGYMTRAVKKQVLFIASVMGFQVNKNRIYKQTSTLT